MAVNMAQPGKDSGADRLTRMLASAMGKVGELLLDEAIVEIMLNPDGQVWQDRLGEGRSFTGHTLAATDAERVIYIVANSIGVVCNKDHPLLGAELPGTGARFQGVLPPIVARPTFTIRKKALKIFSLDDYVQQGILTFSQRDFIAASVQQRKNILIVGGAGSGKTTLANAILDAIAACGQRIVIIEDTQELQCRAEDAVMMRTREGVTMLDLLKATLRLRPDRIVIGEVRGGEALALLKAWNTGHPGGCATVHADSGAKGLSRLEQLVLEAATVAPKTLIAEAVNVVIFIEKDERGRRVKEIIEVNGVRNDNYVLNHVSA